VQEFSATRSTMWLTDFVRLCFVQSNVSSPINRLLPIWGLTLKLDYSVREEYVRFSSSVFTPWSH